jgi:glycosyltransferase involved in cell wall biosynthesis
MFFTVVINVYESHQMYLPRALTGLMNQTFKSFELIVVVDGEKPLSPFDPRELCRQTVPGEVVYRSRSNTDGNRERRHALSLARGKYIMWLNSDNLVYPDWLQNHYSNVSQSIGSISVVNIQYWRNDEFRGKLPRSLACGEMDLLNFALPLDLAKRLDTFGPDVEHLRYADWLAFEKCAKEAKVIWDKAQPVCACHF